MLVVTDIKYDHTEHNPAEFFIERDHSGTALFPVDKMEWGYYKNAVMVYGRTYAMRFIVTEDGLPDWVKSKVQALTDLGAKIVGLPRSYGSFDRGKEFELRIDIGFLEKADDDFFSMFWRLHKELLESAQADLEAANRSASKHNQMYLDVKDQLDREARFSAVHREALWNFKDSLRETSFWKRLTWLFTGVKV
jgi:hypothetical protein